MAQQVPYSPVPGVAPSGQAIQGPRLDTPSAAFGGAVSEATQRVGNALVGAGDELFKRALAMQELANHTEAQEASMNYVLESGKLHAQYNSLQGRDRVLALPKYQEALKALRVSMRDKLSNPMSQRMFDNETWRTFAYSATNAANTAATAQKDWTLRVQKDSLDLAVKEVADNPNDDLFFQEKLNKIVLGARNLAAQLGIEAGSEPEQKLIQDNVSKAWAERLIGLSRSDPEAAAKLLDMNKTKMTSPDVLRVDSQVRTQSRSLGARRIADQVYSPDKTLAEMEEQARTAAQKLNPKDEILAHNAVDALRARYNQSRAATRAQTLQDRDEVSMIIRDNTPRSLADFLAVPGAQQVYDRLPEREKLAIPGQIARYSAALNKPANDQNYLRLWGMSNSNVPEAIIEFLDLDLTKENLSQGQIIALMKRQQGMKDKLDGDFRIKHAVSVLQGSMGSQLEALGVYSRTNDNKTKYDQFTGALANAIEVWTEQQKKFPSDKDIRETIGPQIMRQITVPGMLWGTNDVPFFQATTSIPGYEGFVERAKKIDPKATDEQIKKLWGRMQYQRLFPPTKSQERVK